MKQTAVEWLVEQFNLQAYIPHIEKAKEMEKEQIKDAFVDGVDMVVDKKDFILGDQYYNETFKSE